MKQVFQNMKSGSPELIDVPSPMSKEGELIIGATKSLISKGTEKIQFKSVPRIERYISKMGFRVGITQERAAL